MNFKLILEKIGKEITFKNMDKCFKEFDKGMSAFNKCMNDLFSELSSDIENNNERSKSEAAKNQRNLDILWGSSKSNTKLWSNKK